MKYIKIRKPPEVRPEGDCLKLTTVVSITSDLGDSYRQSPVELKIGISGRNSNKQCDTHTWTWNYKGTHESERIELDISRKICKKVKDSVETDHAGSTVVCLCISTGTHRSPGGFGDQLGIDRNMLVAAQTVSAWTDPFVLDFKHAASKAPPTLQRQFCGLEGPELSIWESTNQSIAGHIWYVCYGALAITPMARSI